MPAKPAAPTAFAITLSGEVARSASAPVKGDDGVLRQRFTKDAIRIGEYRHPVKGWKLKPDAARLNHWANGIRQMLANGVDVEVFADHTKDGKSKKSERADKIRGYVKDAFVEDGALHIVHDAEGEDGISLARRCKNVSIEIENFEDSQGNKYPDAITGIAYVEKPVVHGQQPSRIAASIVDDEGQPIELPQFTLAVGDPSPAAGDDSSASEDLTMLIEAVAKLTGKPCTTADEAVAALNAWKPQAEAPAPAAIAASLCETVGPDVSEMLAEGAEAQLSLLVTEARITPAVKDELHALLIGKPGERKTLSLSPTANKTLGAGTPLAKDIIATLKKLPQIVTPGGRTGTQTLALVREEGDEDKEGDALEKAVVDDLKRKGQWRERTAAAG